MSSYKQLPAPYFYHDSYTVHSYHADFTCKLSIPSLLLFLQESAWHHASSNAFGFDDMLKQDSLWALLRIKVAIHQLPDWGDKVHLVTWSRGAEGYYAYRDFELYSEQGDVLVAASSQWLILDVKTRRPRRADAFKNSFPTYGERKAIDHVFEREHHQPFAEPTGYFQVRPSDTDMNGHVNNTSYVRWALDELGIDFLTSHQLCEADVSFLAESRANDRVGISINHLSENNIQAAVIRESDGKELSHVKLSFKTATV